MFHQIQRLNPFATSKSNQKIASFYGLLCFERARKQEKETTRLPEIHLNLWESPKNTFLDIGLMLDISHPAEAIEIFFPWKIQDGNFIDLLSKISEDKAMPAIFNESWSTTKKANQSGMIVSDQTNNEEKFVVIQSSEAITSKEYDENSHFISIDINKLSLKAHSLSSKIKAMYIRIRINFVPKHFYAVGIDQIDKGFASSWQLTEIIDFRLNVRRGTPIDLESSRGNFLSFGKIHFFLMRSRDYDLVFQDDLFKACRSLEDEDFWASYSKNKNDKIDVSKDRVRRSLGYQWSTKKLTANSNSIKEFSILAKFKKIEFTMGKFLLLAVILGASGSALWDFVKSHLLLI